MSRLSVSNIAWPAESRKSIYALLRDLGVEGVEFALTKIASWDSLNDDAVRDERKLVEANGLTVSSYQALYFGRPDVQLLADENAFEAMLAHTVMVARWAQIMSGGGAGVFGAPRNRVRGSLDEEDAFQLGAERLRRLADAINPYQFVLALEPAPHAYGGDFLTTEEACAMMVAAVDHPSLRLHLDAGCLTMNNETADQVLLSRSGLLGHVHLSRPQLAPIELDALGDYTDIFRSLKQVGYDGWAAIEMREVANFASSVEQAVSVARKAGFLSK